MGWWDDLGTNIGNALIGPQTFGSLMPTPPEQRGAMITNALLSLGGTLSQAGRQGIGPVEALGQGFQNLQTQGAARGQQQLQSMLLMGKIGEQQKRNQTLETLSKTKAPEGWSDDAWKAFVASDPGEAFKVYAASIKQAQDRAAIGGMGDFPGMGGPSGTSAGRPTGAIAPTGDPVLDRISGNESGGRMITNPTSGATGAFQFMPATWRGLMQSNPNAGLTVDGINDPNQQAIAARLFKGQIDKAFGGQATPGQAYLGWFLGPQGAVSLSMMPRNTPINDGLTRIFGADMAQKVIQQNAGLLRGVQTTGDLIAGMDRRMGGGQIQPAPMPEVRLPSLGTPAPMPQPNFPNPAGPNAQPAPMPNMAAPGGRPQTPTQPVQFTPQQGASQPQQSPPADYRSDPVVQEAHQAFRQAQARGDVKGAQEARSKAAERIATLQQQAQTRADRPERRQMREFEDGVYIVDLDTGDKRRIGDRPTPRGEGREFTEEGQLRGEYEKQTKDFQQYRQHYQRILAANEKPSAAGDIAMVYGFMKMLDPTSVVREGEFATAATAGGVPDRIWTVYNKLVNGERLTPEIRKDFLDRASRIFDKSYGEYEQTRKTFQGLATAYGRNPDRVAPDFTAGVRRPTFDEEPQRLGAPSPAAGATPTGQPSPAPAAPKPKPQLRWDGKKLVPVE